MRPLAGVVSYEPSELVVTALAGTPLAELEALRAKAVATGTAGIAFTTTYGAEYARKDGPTLTEARRLNKAFRTLKAGV